MCEDKKLYTGHAPLIQNAKKNRGVCSNKACYRLRLVYGCESGRDFAKGVGGRGQPQRLKIADILKCSGASEMSQ